MSQFVFPPYFSNDNQDYIELLANQTGIQLKYNIKTKTLKNEYPKSLGYPSRSNAYWKPLFKAIDDKYNGKDKILPMGTILYHGSLSSDGKLFKPFTYFGLDVVISLWAASEAFKFKHKDWDTLPRNKWIAYLHEFEVVKPLHYTYLLTEKGTPLEIDKHCSHHACVHPQAILHDNHWKLFQELGTEMTIPLHLIDHVKLKHTYKIDLFRLIVHQISSMLSWSPTNAIIQQK